MDNCQFIAAIPERAGRVLSMCNYRQFILFATEFGGVYVYDTENGVFHHLRP